jgi:hypothetical protein
MRLSALRPSSIPLPSPRLGLMLGGLAMVATLAIFTFGSARGADHADAPGLTGDGQADINDIYAFRSPENNDNLVVVMTVNPLTAPPQNGMARFGSDVAYNIHVDNTGDNVADATVSVTFSGDNFTVGGLGTPITGQVTAGTTAATANSPKVTTAGPIRVFAGQRDDPFFFDLVGFRNFVKAPFTPASGLRPAGETPSDTLAGLNVSAIVMELPITALTGASNSSTGVIKAWGTTSRGAVQVDRMAIPAINTALIPTGMKDAFNAGSPATDATMFRAAAQAQVEGLRSAVATVLGAETGGPLGDLDAATVAGALIPDIVTIDFSAPVAFPNGRRLSDDVVDAALGIVLNRGGAAGIADAIPANDKAFSNTFPYLAAPHQPSAVNPPNTGNAGLVDDGDSILSMLWLALGATLVVVGGTGALAVTRGRS